MSEKLFYVGVKALIKNDNGKLLLLKASTRNHTKNTEPYWDIPGGRIEEGGDVQGTLRREIEEETGITEVTSAEFLTAVVSRHEIPINEDRLAGLVLMVYTVTIPEDSKIRISPEHTDYEWVTPKVAADRLGNKYPAEFTDQLN